MTVPHRRLVKEIRLSGRHKKDFSGRELRILVKCQRCSFKLNWSGQWCSAGLGLAAAVIANLVKWLAGRTRIITLADNVGEV